MADWDILTIRVRKIANGYIVSGEVSLDYRSTSIEEHYHQHIESVCLQAVEMVEKVDEIAALIPTHEAATMENF